LRRLPLLFTAWDISAGTVVHIPSPPRTVAPPYREFDRYCNAAVTVPPVSTISKNICICRLLYKYSTHTVLYCILRYACPSARRQHRLPSPPCTVVVLIAAAYQRTFNNRELFLLLFTTNLFGLAIQRRVSSKQVVPARKKQREQGKTKE